ncbi:HET-domain-containing protein [Durotheca rogersii]|uniref:HET-domain-containing protein n=1 Tax=Durotheca rogersii TaxID=419775 RepID=UPI00221FB94F|nr:HET-domain-containing protein [Durotheca rogersii]KAI5856202.1 HET-domain-containing protein [Durotheca rogersii]
MGQAPLAIKGTLCELCCQFVCDLFAFDFEPQTVYPARWQPISPDSWTEYAWGDGFRHHETLDSLSESSNTCEFCHVLYADLGSLDSDLCQGWLGLYPFWVMGRIGENKHKGRFRAGFRGGLSRMPEGGGRIGSIPLHSFKVCRRGPPSEGEEIPFFDAYKASPAIPSTLSPPEIARKVTRWQQECLTAHPACAQNAYRHELPTRVIDLGEDKAVPIRLYESRGEEAPYVALSHCWGGVIPSVTTLANKMARFAAMNEDDLPRNFRDAIEVARALGIRYLWIDALCIIQDSKADWLREAGKMGTVYAGASVVISALDSTVSTAGFLKPNRVPLAILNDHYAVQKVFPDLYDYLLQCPLVQRGWCMQERLLAPHILHFGGEQMFWECYSDFKCEDGMNFSGESSGHVMAKFMAIRKHIGTSAAQANELQWQAWYQLLEEYTTRNFTVFSDKLPALAGAASLFKSTKPAATYVAGLWKEDIARGLLWGAHYDHMPGRKVWGISPTDTIVELSRPPAKRAPSWSWAALDGQIDFWALRINGFIAEVLEVEMGIGDNVLTEAFPEGTLRLRGAVAQMTYLKPSVGPRSDVGMLTFGQDDTCDDETAILGGCVMDLDRQSSRICWVMIMARSNDSWYLLVLDKRDDGSYRRVGMATSYSVRVDPARFEMEDIRIV